MYWLQLSRSVPKGAAKEWSQHAGQAAVIHPLFRLQGHYDPVAAVSMLPHPGQLLSCDHSGLLIFWDYVTQKAMRKFQHGCALLCLAPRADKQEEILLGTRNGDILRLPSSSPLLVRRPACPFALTPERSEEKGAQAPC